MPYFFLTIAEIFHFHYSQISFFFNVAETNKIVLARNEVFQRFFGNNAQNFIIFFHASVLFELP